MLAKKSNLKVYKPEIIEQVCKKIDTIVLFIKKDSKKRVVSREATTKFEEDMKYAGLTITQCDDFKFETKIEEAPKFNGFWKSSNKTQQDQYIPSYDISFSNREHVTEDNDFSNSSNFDRWCDTNTKFENEEDDEMFKGFWSSNYTIITQATI